MNSCHVSQQFGRFRRNFAATHILAIPPLLDRLDCKFRFFLNLRYGFHLQNENCDISVMAWSTAVKFYMVMHVGFRMNLLCCGVQAWLRLPWAVRYIWRTVQHPAVYFLSQPGSSVLPQRQLHVSRLHHCGLLTYWLMASWTHGLYWQCSHMKVYASVGCLSVRPPQVCCCGLGGQEVDWLLHGRHSAANASSVTLTAGVGSWTQTCSGCLSSWKYCHYWKSSYMHLVLAEVFS